MSVKLNEPERWWGWLLLWCARKGNPVTTREGSLDRSSGAGTKVVWQEEPGRQGEPGRRVVLDDVEPGH